MAINLAIKYGPQIENGFTHESYVKNHCKGKVEFTGAKTVRVYELKTTPMNDYKRSGTSRYGKLEDIEDIVHEYTMTQDKAFTGAVDKGDESEQTITNKAGQWLRQQIREQAVPLADGYALSRMVDLGKVVTISAEPTKSNIISEIFKARTWFNNHRVPFKERVLFVQSRFIDDIMLSNEWVGLDSLAGKQLPTGIVGKVAGFAVIEVPDDCFDNNHFFTAIHSSAVAFAYKLNSTKIHTDPVGINGAVIEGRQLYDVFVLGSKADAVYSLVLQSAQQAKPTITDTNKKAVTLASDSAKAIYYTLDGSDPRFSMTRQIYTAAFDAAGKTLKAVAFGKNDETTRKFTSEIVEKNIASE